MKKRQKKIKNRFISFYNKLVENSKYKNISYLYLIFLASAIALISIAGYFLGQKIANSLTISERNIYIVLLSIAVVIFAFSVYFSIVMVILVRSLYNEKQCRLYFEVYVKYRKFLFLDFHEYSYDELFEEEIKDAKAHPNTYNKIYL